MPDPISETPEAPVTPQDTAAAALPVSDTTNAAAAVPSTPDTIPASAGTDTVPAAAAQDYVSIRDALKERGLSGDWADDETALAELTKKYQEAEGYRQQLEWYQYQQAQQKAAEEKAAAEKASQPKANPFGLPEFDKRWMALVEKDATTGDWKPKPGAPPDLMQKLVGYSSALADVQEKFWTDPHGVLGPVIRDMVQPLIQQAVQGTQSTIQEQSWAQQFVRENSSWLHQKDAAGNILADNNGRPILSPEGKAFRNYVTEAEQMGIASIQKQQEFASRMVERDRLQAKVSGIGAKEKGEQIKKTFEETNGSQHAPSALGNTQKKYPNGAPISQSSKASLRERLSKALADAGNPHP